MKVIKLKSDNFENELVTLEAYEHIRLNMSTGDFHSHHAEYLEVSDDIEVYDLKDFLESLQLEAQYGEKE